MKGYQLTKAFYAEVAQNETMQLKVTASHHSLYTWICELRNQVQSSQPEREILDLPVRYTMSMSFIGSDNTLKKCIDDLAAWGIIEILQKGTNHHVPTKVRISVAYMRRHCDSSAIVVREQSDSSAMPLRPTKTEQTIQTEQIEKQENTPPISASPIPPTQGEGKPKKAATKGETKEHLFKDSPYYDRQLFLSVLGETEYNVYDLAYYHESVKNWADSGTTSKYRKSDWIATARGFMLRDAKDGKAKMKSRAQPLPQMPEGNHTTFKDLLKPGFV